MLIWLLISIPSNVMKIFPVCFCIFLWYITILFVLVGLQDLGLLGQLAGNKVLHTDHWTFPRHRSYEMWIIQGMTDCSAWSNDHLGVYFPNWMEYENRNGCEIVIFLKSINLRWGWLFRYPCILQIYDAGDFSLLCSESARRGERWMGGEFISMDRVAVWSSEGRGYLYKLPTKWVHS